MADYLALPRDPKKAAELTNASVENSISCNKHRFVLCEQTSPFITTYEVTACIGYANVTSATYGAPGVHNWGTVTVSEYRQ